MWLEHLLFGAVDDTSFAVSCKALPCTVRVFLTYTASAAVKRKKFIDKFERDNEVK